MCDDCQNHPRIIDYEINCYNCGNLETLDCNPAKNITGACDLWVPLDFYNYHTHYVSFVVPEWEKFAKLADYKCSELVDSLIGRDEVYHLEFDETEVLTLKSRRIKGPATIIVVKNRQEGQE